MKSFIFALTVFFLSHGASASTNLAPPNKKTIQWIVHDLPPVIQLATNDLNVDMDQARGPIADMYKTLRTSLPEYDHRFLRIPFVRAEKLFKEHKQFCTLLLQENEERSKYLIFGEEVAVTLPSGLIVRKASAPEKYRIEDGHVGMAKTLENNGFRLGIVKSRFYSPELKPILEKDHGQGSLSLVSDGSALNLLAMLSSNRLDGVLAYYFEMTAFEQAHPQLAEFEFLRVKESPNFSVIRASCEKTAWGEKVLPSISKVVREKRFKEKAQQYLLSSLPPQRGKEYQKIYDSRPVAPVVQGSLR